MSVVLSTNGVGEGGLSLYDVTSCLAAWSHVPSAWHLCLISCSFSGVCVQGVSAQGSLRPRMCLCPGEGLSVYWGLCPGRRGLCPVRSLSRESLSRDPCPRVSVEGCVSVQGGEVIVQGSLCPGESLPRGSLPRGGLCQGHPPNGEVGGSCCWKSFWKLWQHGQYVAYRSTPNTTYNNIIYLFIIYTRTIWRETNFP